MLMVPLRARLPFNHYSQTWGMALGVSTAPFCSPAPTKTPRHHSVAAASDRGKMTAHRVLRDARQARGPADWWLTPLQQKWNWRENHSGCQPSPRAWKKKKKNETNSTHQHTRCFGIYTKKGLFWKSKKCMYAMFGDGSNSQSWKMIHSQWVGALNVSHGALINPSANNFLNF